MQQEDSVVVAGPASLAIAARRSDLVLWHVLHLRTLLGVNAGPL